MQVCLSSVNENNFDSKFVEAVRHLTQSVVLTPDAVDQLSALLTKCQISSKYSPSLLFFVLSTAFWFNSCICRNRKELKTIIQCRKLPRQEVGRKEVTIIQRRIQTLRQTKAKLFAEALTQVDHDLFREIKLEEFMNKNWTKDDKYEQAPGIMKMIKRFNGLGHWTMETVLLPNEHSERLFCLKKICYILYQLVALNNFNSASALLAGLLSAPVQKVKNLWEELPSKTRKRFKEVSDLLRPYGNYQLYRSRMGQLTSSDPAIPYFAVVLRDIVAVYDSMEPVGDDGAVNHSRVFRLGEILWSLEDFQHRNIRFTCGAGLLEYCRYHVQLELHTYKELDQHGKKLQQLLRTSSSSASAKPVLRKASSHMHISKRMSRLIS